VQERVNQAGDLQKKINELADQLQRTTDAGESLKIAREISKISRLLIRRIPRLKRPRLERRQSPRVERASVWRKLKFQIQPKTKVKCRVRDNRARLVREVRRALSA
jgi:hypothetical protein